MNQAFEQYLIKQGYSQYTKSGHPSTVYDYQKRVLKVCEYEHTDLPGLASMIDSIVVEYDVGGKKEELGHKSHNAIINALRAFRGFVHSN